MTFDEVILKWHWERGYSINKIAKMCGMSHTPFINLAKLTGIRLRNQSEASSENISILNKLDFVNRDKRARSMAVTFRKKLLPQEIIMLETLDRLKVKYEAQKPIGPYIIDFFIPKKNICIEVDSTRKWGKERRKNAETKDRYLSSLGHRVIRINKVWLKDIVNFVDAIT